MVARSLALKLARSTPASSFPTILVGRITGYEAENVLVDFPGNPSGPRPARLLIKATARELQQAAESGCPVALVFENGDPMLPLVVGLVQAPSAREARVDGERIVLTGEEEIELRCGDASICLRKNGKLLIRGTYVETRAKGTNRIKGGSVQVN